MLVGLLPDRGSDKNADPDVSGDRRADRDAAIVRPPSETTATRRRAIARLAVPLLV